jgi:hypothetical protein
MYSPTSSFVLKPKTAYMNYSRTQLIRVNWDGGPSGFAENPDNWIFLGKEATSAV